MSSATQQTRPSTLPTLSPSSPQFGTNIATSTALFGPTWRVNALAALILGGDPDAAPSLYARIFSYVKQNAPTDRIISPCFKSHLNTALQSTHRVHSAITLVHSG